MQRVWMRPLLGTAALLLLVLALPAGALALPAPINIGSNVIGEPDAPAVAVDSSGTAYIAWADQLSGPPTPTIYFCKLAVTATGCSPVQLTVTGHPEAAFFDPPSVVLSGGDVYVFETVGSDEDNDQNGMDEWVSTDGGQTFTLAATSVSSTPNGNDEPTPNPVIALPGGDIGTGVLVPGGNDPAFQANSLASPADYSAATEGGPADPFASMISPASAYTVGNLGGQFAAQLTGSAGVLGVFELDPGTGTPCPASDAASLVYAWAPLSPTATGSQIQTELNASAGTAGSAWNPLAELDCFGNDPAVGGGPAGLGLLETDAATLGAYKVMFRRFTPPSTWSATAQLATGASSDGSVSQDSSGGVYATWLDPDTGVNLDYSANGGSNWYPVVNLLNNKDGAVPVGALASAVGPTGAGWAVYANNGTEYAQPFDRQDALPPPPRNTAAPKITGTPKAGRTLSCSKGSWTGDPTGYAYQWNDDGTPISGATRSTYTVTALEEGTTISCTVTATNGGGPASATSRGVKVPVPYVAKCPGATGRLSGTTLGLVKLGASRATEHYLYRHHSDRGKQYEDFFCLTPIGVRVGYGSPKLLKILTTRQRKALRDRVVWASTSNPFYSTRGVRAGESIALASARLHTGKALHIGLNYWYLAVQKRSTVVLKVRRGVVEEIGIATNLLAATPADQNVLMHSFY